MSVLQLLQASVCILMCLYFQPVELICLKKKKNAYHSLDSAFNHIEKQRLVAVQLESPCKIICHIFYIFFFYLTMNLMMYSGLFFIWLTLWLNLAFFQANQLFFLKLGITLWVAYLLHSLILKIYATPSLYPPLTDTQNIRNTFYFKANSLYCICIAAYLDWNGDFARSFSFHNKMLKALHICP